MEVTKYKTTEGKTVVIRYDDHPNNPRKEYDEVGHLWTWHRTYDLADGDCPKNMVSPADAMEEGLIPEGSVFLSVYAYDHGSLSIRSSRAGNPFGDGWDSGQLGYVWISPEEGAKEGWTTEEQMLKALENSIEAFGYYVSGEVYEYVVYKACPTCEQDDECVDGCGGFLGMDCLREHLELEYPPAEAMSLV